jgi:hypothetical protein
MKQLISVISLASQIALLMPVLAQAQSAEEELASLCQTILCRSPRTVELTTDDGQMFQTTFDQSLPVVHNDWVSVFPGETLYVEAEINGSQLEALRAVETNLNPEKTIELKMWQEPGKPDIFLTVTNPFPLTVKYHAVMMFPTGEELYKTSSCPVLGNGGSAYEHWPHAIFQLLLFDFRLLDEASGEAGCEF